MSATELAALIRDRQVSAREVTDAPAAHQRGQPGAQRDRDPARRAGARRGRRRRSCRCRPRRASAVARRPVHHQGVLRPRRHPDQAGWKVLANEHPSQDAPNVKRLKAAGAIPIGRTNLATLTVRWHCESELWGTPSTRGTPPERRASADPGVGRPSGLHVAAHPVQHGTGWPPPGGSRCGPARDVPRAAGDLRPYPASLNRVRCRAAGDLCHWPATARRWSL